MTERTVFCKKLNKEAAGLAKPPIPGALGERVYNEISAQAWSDWQNHQTMLINEYRLSMIDPKSRKFLMTEMENFLFGEGSNKPEGYTPEK